MTSREECLKALCRIQCGAKVNKDCKTCECFDDKINPWKCVENTKESILIREVIDEHFEPKENTSEFKHSKLHSDSTLKNLTKVELIDYIKMLYHNWEACDEQLKNCIDKAKELSDSNDELERTIHSLDCELSDVYNPKPYKFEDLKPNMWVWDNVAKECLYVIKPFVGSFTGVKYFTCLGIYKNLEEIRKLDIKFEENRFFPVQCANYLGGI